MAFSAYDFLPHGYCLTWDPFLVSGFVISDALVGLAYYSIPLALVVFIRRNPQLHFGSLFWMFSLFIFACGTGHFISILNIWSPMYRLDASVRIVTAVVSVATALLLIPIMPRASAMLRFNREASERLSAINAELQQANAALLESEARTRLILENAPIGLAIVGLDGRFVSVNRTLCEMLGYGDEELRAKTFQDITHADDIIEDMRYVEALLAGQRDVYRLDKRYIHALGGVVHIQLDVAILRDAQQQPVHFIAQIQDIGDRIQQSQHLERLAMLDSLTGLPNRRAFLDEAERVVLHARRQQQPVALMMIDLDHFKQINDAHGHPSGDRVLQSIREIVLPCLRGGDILARLGGEEFAALLPNASAAIAVQQAERVRQAIATAALHAANGLPIKITASIGVVSLAGAVEIGKALEHADRALYEAKRSGRNQVIHASAAFG